MIYQKLRQPALGIILMTLFLAGCGSSLPPPLFVSPVHPTTTPTPQLFTREQLQQTISEATEAIRLNPENAAAYYERGNAYLDLGYFGKAIEDYTKFIELVPDKAEAYYKRGLADRYYGYLPQAVADYTKAIELEPDYIEAYIERGDMSLMDSGYDFSRQKVIQDYTKAIQLRPNDAGLYNRRGCAYAGPYAESSRLEQAIRDYNKAVALDPENANIYGNRGHAYLMGGEKALAIQDFERYLKLSPNASNRTEVVTQIQEIKSSWWYQPPYRRCAF